MKPNASIITFLTLSEIDKELIFFIYIKEVDDLSPTDNQIHWYKNYGQAGNAIFLSKKYKIKQWFAVGSDDDIDNLFKTLEKECFYEKDFGKSKVRFELFSKLEKVNYNNDKQKIPDVDKFQNERIYYTFGSNNFSQKVPFVFEEETLFELEGYKKSNENEYSSDFKNEVELQGIEPKIKPLYPLGLFEKGFLKNCFINATEILEKIIVCVYEKRGVYSHFHGVKDEHSKKNGVPNSFVGFIQLEQNERSNYEIVLSDFDKINQKISSIDTETGFWSVEFGEPLSKGKYYLIDKKTKENVYGENFYLLLSIDINLNITEKVYKDLYERKLNKSKFVQNINIGKNDNVTNENNDIQKPDNLFWQKSLYTSEQNSFIILSDKISNILKYLSPSILISDPYVLGNIDLKDNKCDINESQKVFINAIYTSLINNSIKEIRFIGCKKRLKNFTNKTFDELINIYKKLFENFHEFDINRVTLKFSNENFHDRYWIGIKKNNPKIFSVTNSISGLVESSELKINYLESTVDRIKLFNLINSRWENSESEEYVIYSR